MHLFISNLKLTYFKFISSLLVKVLKQMTGNSLAVQWLGLCTFTAEGLGSISGQGTKINPAIHAPWPKKPKKITISLTVFPTLYISPLRLIYFVSRNLYLFISLTYFTPPQPASPLANICLFSASMSVFLFCYVGSFVF